MITTLLLLAALVVLIVEIFVSKRTMLRSLVWWGAFLIALALNYDNLRRIFAALALVLLIAPMAYAQDLRREGTDRAIAAAVQDAVLYQGLSPCHTVPSGDCVKLPLTGVDYFAITAIVADNVCAFYDIVSTLAGTLTDELRELNPWLAPYQKNWPAMVTIRAGVQVVKWFVFHKMRHKGPTWAKWTGVTASATAGLGCGAAIHNTLEMRKG